uniref:Uncharacterized protein n=1 Tax=uncultured bacterium BLR9 TaxID=506525 RepID=C0INC2_9BACT|nr:hypothetical protein AKSOIL_0163 [uncultured bacterium BLR9]
MSMIEAPEAEKMMVDLATEIDPELTEFSELQKAAYNLAHAIRDTFVAS